jgi:succinate dehydrogenase / fumarate reductase, membrane anchor subunit
MASLVHPVERPVTRNRWGIFSWAFMRISALALIFLTLGHFGIQHVVNDVHDLTIDFVVQRWQTLFWPIYDALLLALALTHGLNGLRIVIDDYVLNPKWNRIARIALVVVGVSLIIIGAGAIIGIALQR